MSPEIFETFKATSQQSYAASLARSENIPLETARLHATEQLARIVTDGLQTPKQFFFDVIEGEKNIGYLWLALKTKHGKTGVMINDIAIHEDQRGQGFGEQLMRLVEAEARKANATQIYLHVFQHNEPACRLYEKMGFLPTDIDMRKDLTAIS